MDRSLEFNTDPVPVQMGSPTNAANSRAEMVGKANTAMYQSERPRQGQLDAMRPYADANNLGQATIDHSTAAARPAFA